MAVPDEAALLALERRLTDAGIEHAAIREPDKPWNDCLTAIGIYADRARLRPHLSSLPKLGKLHDGPGRALEAVTPAA